MVIGTRNKSNIYILLFQKISVHVVALFSNNLSLQTKSGLMEFDLCNNRQFVIPRLSSSLETNFLLPKTASSIQTCENRVLWVWVLSPSVW